MYLRTFKGMVLGMSAVALVSTANAKNDRSKEELHEIAREAYIYAYPLVLMKVTADVGTNVATPAGLRAPINQMAHAKAYPDSTFTDIVRPNADTLYSSLHFDVSKEPLVINIPDSGGRYYLLPILDAWTDIFTSPGSRTTGTQAQSFILVGPNWKGELPANMKVYRSPTNTGLVIGRTQTNGKADYAAVNKFQEQIKVYPLSPQGKTYTPPRGNVNPNQDMSAPPSIVEKMSAEKYFNLLASLLKEIPPHANDYPILDRMKKLGMVPGKSFDFKNASKEIREALTAAPKPALASIKNVLMTAGQNKNHWKVNLTTMGTYGTSYLQRAGVAFAGLGANVVEDAIYPIVVADSEGRPFSSNDKYQIHFKKDQLPPVNAFWSLTMYDERQLFTNNTLQRFAIGDRDKLTYNKDGSLDIYIQKDSPGKDKESNWLPAPQSGAFSMNLRLYWPKNVVLNGTWSPPPVNRVTDGRSLSSID